MKRELIVLTTLEEKRRGLHGKAVVPSNTVYFFANVGGAGGVVETQGFTVPIRVYFLDARYQPLPTSEWAGGARYLVQDAYSALLKPNGMLSIPSSAAHFVELGFTAPPLSQDDWTWLWKELFDLGV